MPEVLIRQRPQPFTDPHGPPSRPAFVALHHPANGLPFITLPAYDLFSLSPLQFGIHHRTAVTACCILACNNPGYLSTSRDRDSGRVEDDLDSIILVGRYYYHLGDPGRDALYPICRDFETWTFPHQNFPASWDPMASTLPSFHADNWTVQSQRVKDRDQKCLVTGWKDSLTTAHIVGKQYEEWLSRNEMDVHLSGLSGDIPLGSDSCNLFALRYDLHYGQFDQAQFVVVPKSGQFVVHFLRRSEESALRYHNTIFDHHCALSPELLYARFAWALMRIVSTKGLVPKKFKFPDNDGGSGKPSGAKGGHVERRPKRQRRDSDLGAETHSDDQDNDDDGDTRYMHGPGESTLRRQILHCEAHPVDAGIYTSCDLDARELEEDMKKAARTLPFFVDPDQKASPSRYERIRWYPGRAAMERKKLAYLNEHPQIKSHSDQLLPDDYDASDDDMS